jgi:hypothetical protein
MKQYLRKSWIAGILAVIISAQAQPQEILEKYKPVIDLSMQLVALLEMEKTTELTLTSEQATDLLPIFSFLQTSETLTNDEATTFKQQMDEQILSSEQRAWLATKVSELAQRTPDRSSPPPGGMGMVIKLMRGEPVNLVKEGPSKAALSELVDILNQKTP